MRLKISLLLIFITISSYGQNKQLLYNVNYLPQSLMQNPGGIIDLNGHLGVPLLSQIHLGVGSSGINLHDVFGRGEDINQRIRNTIRRMTPKDYFVVNQQLEILSLGWRLNPDHYISGGIYQEFDAFAYFPKDAVILANEGNNNYINVPFDFSQVAFTGEMMTVYHLGLNKRIDRRLTVGARAKFYSGIFNAESVDNTGIFLTQSTPEGPNYYRHFADNLNIRINTSGYASLTEQEGMTVDRAAGELINRSFFGGNVGVGLDVGATYELDYNFIISGSVLDLGMMFQRRDVENYLYYGSYQTDGIDPLFPELEPGETTFRYWDIFEDDVEANLIDETLNESYTTWRPFKINGAIEYAFGEYYGPCDYREPSAKKFANYIGMHLFAVNRPKGLKYALTTYMDKRFNENLNMKLSYTLDDFSFTNVGLLVSTRAKFFNFYLAADNLIGYFDLAKSNGASLQMGFQFILD